MEAIIEVWCSPCRREDYSVKIIPLCAGGIFQIEDDIKSYIDWTGDFFTDVFGDDFQEVTGLWKVVFALGVSYSGSYDWEGTPDGDVEFSCSVLFKGQCESWTEMKYTWLDLTNKTEEYFKKPWKIENAGGCGVCTGTGISSYFNHGYGEHSIEAIKCETCQGFGY